MGDGYDSQESVIYWKFTDITEWCKLKYNIHAIRSGVSYGDRRIKWLQALAWWLIDLTLRGNIIDLNNFKTDILSDSIEESRIDFKDTRDVKGELENPKELSHEKWN